MLKQTVNISLTQALRNTSTTPTELPRKLLLKFTTQNTDTATARNVQVASVAFHCYSSRAFREKSRTDIQKVMLFALRFLFSFNTSIPFWVTVSPYGASLSLSLDSPLSVRLLAISPSHKPLPDNTHHWQKTDI